MKPRRGLGGPGASPTGRSGILFAVVALGLLVPTLPAPAGAAGALGTSPSAAVPGLIGTGWTTYHGSANRSGYSPYAGPNLATIAWSTCVSLYHLRASPVTDGVRLFVADDLGTLFARNLSDNGSALWNASLGVEPLDLEVADGELLAATAGGNLSAFDAATGAPRWTLSLGAPIVQGTLVAFGGIFVGTSTGLVEGFNLTTGSALWRATLPGGVGGALTADAGRLFVVGRSGAVEALAPDGSPLWTATVGAGIATAAAAGNEQVVVGDLAGDLTAFRATDGAVAWSVSGAIGGHPDSIHATPTLAPGVVYVQLDSGSVLAVNSSDGATRWETPGQFSPFENLAALVATPTAIYEVVNSQFAVWRIDPATGATLRTALLGTYIFASPALADGTLYVPDDGGCVTAYGRPGGAFLWTVDGTVAERGGAALAGAEVNVGGALATTDANGSFSFGLPNGSYVVTVIAPGFAPVSLPLDVAGSVPPLAILLVPLTLYPVAGVVENGRSDVGLAGARVTLVGPYGFTSAAITSADGSFRLAAPNGTSTLTATSSPAFLAASATVVVAGGPVGGVILRPTPVAYELGHLDPYRLAVLLPIAAIAVAGLAAATWELARRRVARGLPPGLLSPFARYLAMRALLIPVQTVLLLAVLYFFGTVLLDIGLGRPPGALAPGRVAPGCTWGNPACATQAFFLGFGTLVGQLFTGQWGYAVYHDLREPVTQFLAWWLPNSFELGAIALALSVAIAYPVALRAGWSPEGRLDPAARTASVAGMLLPSFLVGLLLLLAFAPALGSVFGDSPFGELPATAWFVTHGGYPAWVGVGSNTSPTGLPLVDGLLHGDWAFESVVLVKTLLQAFAIAIVYVAVFLRHARHLAAEAAREPNVAAARARGVPEGRLLWTHTGRRVLPVYVLLVSLTLPVFLGTQAVIETIFSDPGFGTILFLEITHVQQTPLGFTGPLSGNFYQVAIFLLILLVLAATLGADVLAKYLDPRERGKR